VQAAPSLPRLRCSDPASFSTTVLNLRHPDSFDVARPRQIEVSPGDKILRANDKRLGLTNGQLLTISSITPDGGLQTKEGQRVPADFRQWCHGYVVTSHKAQGWTADHVVIAAESFTSKGAYVACSRGRRSCTITYPGQGAPDRKIARGKSSRRTGCAFRELSDKRFDR
jgi:ATP-dependent exoDNAse (exonuclease V) alpha subunit